MDFYFLERNGERLFSSIWNGRESDISKENITKNCSSFCIYCDQKELEKTCEIPVFMYDMCDESRDFKMKPIPRAYFPEKAFKHPFYENLKKIKLVENDSSDPSQKCAIRLISAEVAKNLFNHYHCIDSMQQILNGSR